MRTRLLRLLWLAGLAALAVCVAAVVRSTNQPTLRYSALGDSITWGAGASAPSSSWVARYADELGESNDAPVAVANLGVPGATSGDLLRSVSSDDAVRRTIAHSDVITIAIGTNDFYIAKALHRNYEWGTCGGSDNQRCLRDITGAYRTNLHAIIDEVRALTRGRDVAVQLIGVYSGDASRDRAEAFAVFNGYLIAMNSAAAEVARENGYDFIDVRHAFNGVGGFDDPAAVGYTTATDTVHPSDAGHEKIAELVSASFTRDDRDALVAR